jgi:hypothetical protein
MREIYFDLNDEILEKEYGHSKNDMHKNLEFFECLSGCYLNCCLVTLATSDKN